MATRKNNSNESARIAGAQMGLAALRKLERESEADIHAESAAEYSEQRLSAVRAFVAGLGPMTPEQEGAIAVLVEYIHADLSGGTPNLAPDGWIPLSAMTAAERQAEVERMDAEHAADELTIETARKVVSIADWIPAR